MILGRENPLTQLFGLRGFSKVTKAYDCVNDGYVLTLIKGDAEHQVPLPGDYRDWTLQALRTWVDERATEISSRQAMIG